MQPSLFGLAVTAVLTVAAFGPADAHFASARRFVAPARPNVTNHFRQADRFDTHDRGGFHRQERRGLQLAWGYPDVGVLAAPANISPVIAGSGGTTINLTVVTSAFGPTSPEPANYGASAGPKIIIIGRARSPHIGKLPKVIYGVRPL